MHPLTGSGPKKHPAIFDPPGPVPHRIARSSRLQVSWRHREKKPVVFKMRRMPVWGAPENFVSGFVSKTIFSEFTEKTLKDKSKENKGFRSVGFPHPKAQNLSDG